MDEVDQIWFDGRLVPWEQASVHVATHTLHYGLGAFEGIRCYKLHDGRSAIFRLDEHVRRLFDSAHICMLPMPYSQEQIVGACLETVRENGLDDYYLRPIAFMGSGEILLGARSNPTHVAVVAWRLGAYPGEEVLKRGIRAKVSSFQRAAVNTLMSKGKISGHYVSSILAKREVQAIGYDEAIMLDTQGYVSETSAANIFVVRDGEVATPPMGVSILGGITRSTVMRLMENLGLTVHERLISRDELYIADEVFVVGTAAEVTPVRELDDRQVGKGSRGPITERVQDAYCNAVRGVRVPDEGWLTIV